jgi:hypothetical protein
MSKKARLARRSRDQHRVVEQPAGHHAHAQPAP